jgi:hypothetical protein
MAEDEMLRIDKNEKKLVRLTKSALAEAEHWERHLQAMIFAEPDAFCEEIGESLWLIGQEVRPSDAVSDRIDILAIDEDGSAVVMELKRGSHKLQLLQAVSYAGMVSRWTAERFIETLAVNYKESNDDARTAIEEHTGSEISAINKTQRILLIAEDFDPALLISAEWLHENYGVDIRCYRLQLSQENNNEYLTCTCIYPPIEIATLTRGSDKKSGQAGTVWVSWDAALEGVENGAVKDFVRAELAKKQESRLANREIIYRRDGKRRFYLSCRQKYAYVWQAGRFEGDDGYWKKVLSEPSHVREVNSNRALRFRLATAADFGAFSKAMSEDLTKVEFSEAADLGDAPSDAE